MQETKRFDGHNRSDTITTGLGGEISREPSDYQPTRNFLCRFSPEHGPVSYTRTTLPITGEVGEMCIQHGCVETTQDGAIRFVATVEWIEWHLIAWVADGRHARVLTAYTPDWYHVEDGEEVGVDA